jgi:glucokinase
MAKLPRKKAPKKQTAKQTSPDFTIGLDLGGTKVAIALVDNNGKIVKQTDRPVTPPSMPQLDPRDPYKPTPAEIRMHIDHVATVMAEGAREVADALSAKDQRLIRGIGLASAGPMDLNKGLLLNVSNMKGWAKVPIVQKLSDACKKQKLPVANMGFQNDAMAAALGEGWIGRAKGANTYVMITVGTGIGTGVIFNGKPAQSAGMGSEWGHILSDVRGISNHTRRAYDFELEGMASGTGLVRQAKLRGLDYENAQQIADDARKGKREALDLFLACSEALAGMFFTLSLGFNPEVFAVSGGMIAIEDLFLPRAIEIYREAIRSKYPVFEKPIKISKLGTKAGVIGAARLPRL